MKLAIQILTSIILCAGIALAQSPASKPHPGVVLFEQAKFDEAIASLEKATKSPEYATDPEIWNYLGLAYMANNEPRKSRKAFEKSVELNPSSSVYQGNLGYALLVSGLPDKATLAVEKTLKLDPKNSSAYRTRAILNLWSAQLDSAEADVNRAIELDPKNSSAYLLKSEVIVAKLNANIAGGGTLKGEVPSFKRAAETLEAGIAHCASCPDRTRLESELDSITAFYHHYEKSMSDASAPQDKVTPLRIRDRPAANYSDRAQANNVEGTVRLTVLLGASGRVEGVLVRKGLGYGLDELAIAAARKIKFEPKKRNGKPESTVITIDYSFSSF